MFASERKDEVRALTSILRLLFSDELAVKYSWKGQKGKNSLHNLNIFNIIISKSIFGLFTSVVPNLFDNAPLRQLLICQ